MPSQLIMGLLLILFIATSATTTAASLAVVLGYDGCTNTLHLLVLLFDLLCIRLRVRVEPRLAILQCIHDLFFLVRIHLLAQAFVLTRAFCSRAHGVDVTVEGVLCVHTLLYLLVFIRK